MSITKILNDEKMADDDKLSAIAETVAAARAAYGNEDVEIAVPAVNTVHGSMPFDMLEDDAKVSVLRSRVGALKAEAVEYAAQNPGVNLNKKIEELLATNSMFTNISAGTKFEYI